MKKLHFLINEICRGLCSMKCVTFCPTHKSFLILSMFVCLISWLFCNTRTKPHLNSLWPNDAIWWQRSESTMAQVMASCLTVPSHYLDQCWLIISEVQWHSYKSNFTRDASTIHHLNLTENCLPKISFKFRRGQWIMLVICGVGVFIVNLNKLRSSHSRYKA